MTRYGDLSIESNSAAQLLAERVGPIEAAHVASELGDHMMRPGSFVRSLIDCMCKADSGNLAKLSQAFPAYGAAVDLWKNYPGGSTIIRDIAGVA